MIEFSLTLPRCRDENDPVPYRQSFEFAQLVDRLGYSGGFIGHHSFSPEVMDEVAPFVYLAALAAHTQRIRLGTGVYLAALHHPANICEQVSTLDRVSNGCAVLGVAVGYRPRPAATPGTGTSSRSTTSPVYPPPVQRPHPPIYVGGTSAGAIRRAARVGDT